MILLVKVIFGCDDQSDPTVLYIFSQNLKHIITDMLITAISVDQLLHRLTFSKNITLNIVVVPNFVFFGNHVEYQ